MLIIVCGLPGSGKTTLSRELAKRLHAIHISSDAVRKEALANPTYSDKEKEGIYGKMADMAAAAIKDGKDVIVDTTCYKREHRARFMRIADTAGVGCRMILCTLSEEETKMRLSRRGPGNISDADFTVYLKVRDVFEKIDEEHIEVDCSKPIREMVGKALDFIGER